MRVGRPDEVRVLGLVERDSKADGDEDNGRDRARPLGGPFAEDPSGDGEDEEAAEQEREAVDSVAGIRRSAGVEAAVDVGEPDGGSEERDGGELLHDLHPGAGTGQDLRPRGLEAEQHVRRRKAEAESGEDGEGDPRGLHEREADGRAHERSRAGRGDHGGEDSGEEAAGIAGLGGELAAGAGEREAEIELACE